MPMPNTASTSPRELPVGHSRNKLSMAKHRRDAVEQNDDLAMRHAVLQQLVVDVLAVGGEDGTAADQAADDGE